MYIILRILQHKSKPSRHTNIVSDRTSGRGSSKGHRHLILQHVSDQTINNDNITKDKKEHD
jgi:hypothetical protein